MTVKRIDLIISDINSLRHKVRSLKKAINNDRTDIYISKKLNKRINLIKKELVKNNRKLSLTV